MEPRTEAGLRRLLSEFTPRQREALRRYYSLGQHPAQIQADTGVTEAELKRIRRQLRHAFLENSPKQK